MTIGIAIPTYVGHLYNLENLLYQISKSTVLPAQVSVSISSFDGDLELNDYPFELILTKNSEFQNVSQNCNTAASKLTTDIISFFGGDDLPHIKRNEFIIKSFESGCTSVVHNYINGNKNAKEFTEDIGEIQLMIDCIDTHISDEHFPVSSKDLSLCFANGPISISKEIFNKFKYNENPLFFKSEDSVYNSNLVKNGYNISYIRNNLMIYIH
jgi:hypothetical protein